MFPLVHPGVAYLVYALYGRYGRGAPPGGRETLVLVFAATLPDLMDQPLYHLGMTSTTRTVGHSVLAGVVLSIIVVRAARWWSIGGQTGRAFAAGYFLHLAADAVWPLLLWIPAELQYLGWPIVHQPPYEGTKPLLAVGDLVVTTVWVELVLFALALLVWWQDGRPGVPHVVSQG